MSKNLEHKFHHRLRVWPPPERACSHGPCLKRGGGGRDVVSVNSGVANSQGVVGWSPGKGWEMMEKDGKERGGERDREIQIEEDRGIEIGDR